MTENQKSGLDLRQSKFVQSMLDASMNGVIMLEPVYGNDNEIEDFIVRAANKATAAHVGIEPKDAVDKPMSVLVPGYKETGFFDVYVTALETKKVQRKELPYKDDRLEGWYEIGVAPNDNFVVVTFANITSFKQSQQELETSATRLDAIINTSQSGIFLFKPVFDERGEVTDFIFTKANPALASYVGQNQEVVNGSLGSKWFPAYKTNGLFDRYRETYVSGKTDRFDFHYYGDNIDVWLDIMATRLGDEVLVTFTDYTGIKRLQLELEESVSELKRSNANLEEFAYVASHDLQEPLRKIQYFSDRLKLLCGENDTAGLLNRMETATIRMRTLIDDLLQYSRFSFNSQKLESVDLSELVHQVLNDLEASINDKNASITVQQLPAVQGDKVQLQQLFQNVISNALKYNRDDVSLRILIASKIVNESELQEELPFHDHNKNFHLIEVSDNGIGFEQSYAKRVFKIFQRLHGRSEYPGTGVGLAIVQKVAENHKGHVFARSAPGRGATFSILLPV